MGIGILAAEMTRHLLNNLSDLHVGRRLSRLSNKRPHTNSAIWHIILSSRPLAHMSALHTPDSGHAQTLERGASRSSTDVRDNVQFKNRHIR
jgi:hypothetical protein